MSLRLRLLLGYGYLVLLLLVTAISAVAGFLHLGEGVERVLEDNFRSIAASMEMVEALERQDSATLALLLDDETSSSTDRAERRRELAEHEAAFLASLEEAEQNITEDEETAVLEEIRALFGRYREGRGQLLEETPARPLAAYNRSVYPAFFDAKRAVLHLLDINQQAMIEADREARRAATRSAAWLGFLVTLALLSLVFLSRAMQEKILGRLVRLREITEAISQGADHRRLPTGGADELDLMAEQFNQALDLQAELSAQMEGRLAQQRQLSLALVERLDGRTAVVALDGDVLIAGGAPFSREVRDALAGWAAGEEARELRQACPEDEAAHPANTDGGDGAADGELQDGEVRNDEARKGEVRVIDEEPHRICLYPEARRARVDTPEGPVVAELLVAGERRPVAWLVRLEEGGASEAPAAGEPGAQVPEPSSTELSSSEPSSSEASPPEPSSEVSSSAADASPEPSSPAAGSTSTGE